MTNAHARPRRLAAQLNHATMFAFRRLSSASVLTVAASEIGRFCGSMLWKSIQRLFVSSASQRWVLELASLQSDLTVHLKPDTDNIVLETSRHTKRPPKRPHTDRTPTPQRPHTDRALTMPAATRRYCDATAQRSGRPGPRRLQRDACVRAAAAFRSATCCAARQETATMATHKNLTSAGQ